MIQRTGVKAYAGCRAMNCPRQIDGGKGWQNVKVVREWVQEDRTSDKRTRCFQIIDEEGGMLLIFHDPLTGNWYLQKES